MPQETAPWAAPAEGEAPWGPEHPQQTAPAPTKTPLDRFAQDEAITEAWAQGHPIAGPIARGLVTGGHVAANTLMHPYDTIAGMLSPFKDYYDYARGKDLTEPGEIDPRKITGKAALSVLPEALGTGLGTVAGGAIYGKMGEAASDIAEPIKGSIGKWARTPENRLRPGVRSGAATIGAMGGGLLGAERGPYGAAAGASSGAYIGPKLADVFLPNYPGYTAEMAERGAFMNRGYKNLMPTPGEAGTMARSVEAPTSSMIPEPRGTAEPAGGAGTTFSLTKEQVAEEIKKGTLTPAQFEIAKARGMLPKGAIIAPTESEYSGPRTEAQQARMQRLAAGQPPTVSGGAPESTAARMGPERRVSTEPYTGVEHRQGRLNLRTGEVMAPPETVASIPGPLTDQYANAMAQARKELGPEASVKEVMARRDEIVGVKPQTQDIGTRLRQKNPEPPRAVNWNKISEEDFAAEAARRGYSK
jgi:hypothetical protein